MRLRNIASQSKKEYKGLCTGTSTGTCPLGLAEPPLFIPPPLVVERAYQDVSSPVLNGRPGLKEARYRNDGRKDEYGRVQDVPTGLRDRCGKRRPLGPSDLWGFPRLQGTQLSVNTLALPSRTCTLRLRLGHVVGGVDATAPFGRSGDRSSSSQGTANALS
jgi:hypothetical protein